MLCLAQCQRPRPASHSRASAAQSRARHGASTASRARWLVCAAHTSSHSEATGSPSFWTKPAVFLGTALASTALSLTLDVGSAHAVTGLSTYFDAIGTPTGDCAMPTSDLTDSNGKTLPFVALNINKAPGSQQDLQGLYRGGVNCGRWMRITLGKNCEGGSNSQRRVCQNGTYRNDQHTGKTIYGYVCDGCSDDNYWCRNSTGHVDISTDYLESRGLLEPSWNGRVISWEYISSPPNGYTQELKFMWPENAFWSRNNRGSWLSLIIYNTPNGVSKVEQNVNGRWQEVRRHDRGLQYDLTEPPQRGNLKVRVFDKANRSYGQFSVPFDQVCGDRCTAYTSAPATRS